MKKLRLLFCALPLTAAALLAQPSDNDLPPPDGPQGEHGRRPPPPVMAVLDANHDGVISAEEIANAPAALRTLDKNGDGQLTQDELRPPRPAGGRGPGGPRSRGPEGRPEGK